MRHIHRLLLLARLGHGFATVGRAPAALDFVMSLYVVPLALEDMGLTSKSCSTPFALGSHPVFVWVAPRFRLGRTPDLKSGGDKGEVARRERRHKGQSTAPIHENGAVEAVPAHPTEPPAPPHAHHHAKRSPQSLIAPRRESPSRLSKAAPRRAGQSYRGVVGSRGIGRGVAKGAFAPQSSTAPPPVRSEWAGRT